MFFKRLELYGFKSFAEKTVLDFEAGVTAIVGPNGTGKSNLSDAIKWVLGEQSVRSMRGGRMEDVIFHGADDIPAIGFAEVSLVISNHNKTLPLDYEEIVITRRIFRSGESEYFINKIPVRLKDILELLMDTGLGMRSYSLMEQGRVDHILNSRPQERRDVFEEASGITKYKSQKEEALRKLERTQENLQRLGDIIVEVKRQIKSIERQANKARRYKEEFEKLKEYELKVSQYQYQGLRKEKKELEDTIKHLDKEEKSIAARIDAAVSELGKIKQELSCVEENISCRQLKAYEVSATIKTTDNKITLDQERIEELSAGKENLGRQIAELEKKIVSVSEQVEQACRHIENIEQQKQLKNSLAKEKEENIDDILIAIKKVQKEISEYKTQEVEVITRQTRTKNNLTKLEANLANLNARLRRLNIENERTEQEFVDVEEKYKVCENEIDSLNKQSKQLTKEIWDLKSSRELRLEKKHKLDFRLDDINRKITSFESKLNFLKEITEKYEGFSKGVKSVLSAREKKTLKAEGIFDVVANLVEVSSQHQIAIERALGENIQAIVVENKQAAVGAIDYLKTEDKGQAKFIFLDGLRANRIKEGQTRYNLDRAVDYVKVESKYQRLLEYLLANTFIVQNLEDAYQLLKGADPQVKLVTLNGEVVTENSITAASSTSDSGLSLLGRQERIAQAEDELKKVGEEKAGIENLQTTYEAQINEINEQIQQKEPNLNKLKINKAAKESEKANVETERKRFQDEAALLKLELEETTAEIQQLQTEKSDLNEELNALQQNQGDLQEKLSHRQNLINEKSQQRQDTLVEIAEIKANLSALDKETEDAKTRQKMISESAAEQKESLQARKAELQDAAVKVEQLKEEIAQLRLQNKELSQTKLDLEQELAQASETRQKIFAAIRKSEDSTTKNQRELDAIREKKASLQVKHVELNYKQDSLKERMVQSYQVDLEGVLADVQEVSVPLEYIFEEIEQLKRKLEGMGPVNLIAIEENEQLQQRYSFLISQQEDLIKAQESLRKAIVQINHTARKVFADTFQKIEMSFKEYFRILFGGGDARLIILEEDNILESGIEIVVRPPGKKLQNISLLSGGEKTLTAIALLFAVFKIKPSPFCILDEVDAALDEANIDRFTNLLSEFIKTSQFIIVTHNKKTINMADIMYGITMEKSGISKIVSVRFKEDEESAAAEELAQIER